MLKYLWNLAKVYRDESLSPAKAQALQERRLQRIIWQAATEVPFYAQHFAMHDLSPGDIRSLEDLEKVPLLHRNEYRQQSEEDRRSGYFDPRELELNATSGSTGKPLVTFEAPSDLQYLRTVFIHDLMAAGLRPWHKGLYFRAGKFASHPLDRFGIMPFRQINPQISMDEQVTIFQRERPNFLYGYFGSVLMLTMELKKRSIKPPKISGMLLGGEHISLANRRMIEEFFKCPITEYYGSTECFTIARGCRSGQMHLRRGEIIVEVLQDDGTTSRERGEGEIVITRLVGRAMPLIRYRIGDRIKLSPSSCLCGSSAPVVEDIIGRTNDLIVDANGNQVHAYGVKSIVDYIAGIDQVQFLQTEPGFLTTYVVAGSGGTRAIQQLMSKLKQTLPTVHYDLQIVDSIPREKSGKIKLMKSELGFAI